MRENANSKPFNISRQKCQRRKLGRTAILGLLYRKKLHTVYHHHHHHHRTKRLWWRAVRRLRGHQTKFRKSFESACDGTPNQKLSDTAETIVQDSLWQTVQSSCST